MATFNNFNSVIGNQVIGKDSTQNNATKDVKSNAVFKNFNSKVDNQVANSGDQFVNVNTIVGKQTF